MAKQQDKSEVLDLADLSDGLSDDLSYEQEEEITLESIKHSQTINFPLRSTYVSRWSPQEAFRELVQNWRDAIVRSSNLNASQFRVIREEQTEGRDIEIIFKVPRPTKPNEYLGYIRFSGRDGLGHIDITNKNATLQPSHLDMGGTSKARDATQAGVHGEGLKVALLVLQRSPQNHRVRCVTGSFSWAFNFTNKGKLVARLRRMKPQQLQRAVKKAEQLAEKSLVPFAARPDRDVQFLMGEKGSGRSEHGEPVKRTPIRVENFRKWCQSALFLEDIDEGNIYRTNKGDLITEPRLCGNLYLKGLLLKKSTQNCSASRTGMPLNFGYNFYEGETDREREVVSSSGEESRAIQAIWHRLLLIRPTLTNDLVKMLNSSEPKYADVAGAEKTIKVETAVRLKEYLFSDESKWYYSTEELRMNPKLNKIIHGFGREGVELLDSFWDVLNSHKLVRAAEEEQRRRFLAAETISIPPTSFARQVDRLLRASIRGCPQTKDTTAQFVAGGSLSLSAYYLQAEGMFKIHERWLQRQEAVKNLGLFPNTEEGDALFHTVKRLYGQILDQVPEDMFQEDADGHGVRWQKRCASSRAEQRLLAYNNIKEHLNLNSRYNNDPNASRLDIKWRSGYLGWSKGSSLRLELHRADICFPIKDFLVASDVTGAPTRWHMTCPNMSNLDAPADGPRVPQCMWKITEHANGYCNSFNGLIPGTEYFGVVFDSRDPHFPIALTNNYTAPEPPSPRVASPQGPCHSYYNQNPIEALNILAPRRWYEAQDNCGLPVVIGLPDSEAGSKEIEKTPSRKRQRC